MAMRMTEYVNSYGDIYKIPRKSLVFLRNRPKKHVLAEVKELTQRIKKRHPNGASITQRDASLELGIKMKLIRQVFSDLIKEGAIKQAGEDRFSIQ